MSKASSANRQSRYNFLSSMCVVIGIAVITGLLAGFPNLSGAYAQTDDVLRTGKRWNGQTVIVEEPNPDRALDSDQDIGNLLKTLERFRSSATDAGKAFVRPEQRPTGLNTQLTIAEQKVAMGSVRRCYSEDTEARNYATFTAHLLVTVDATGEARIVQFKPDTAARMAADPGYRALAERARDAVLSPTCSKLPIPPNLLGKTQQLSFVFRP